MSYQKTKLIVSAIFIAALSGCGGSEMGEPNTGGPASMAPIPQPSLVADIKRKFAELQAEKRDRKISCPELESFEIRVAKWLVSPPNDEQVLERAFNDLQVEYHSCFSRVARARAARRSGEWREKDGVFVCDGYVTRFAEDDFCSAEPPDDWKPYSFNGEEYYFQPLSNADLEQTVHRWTEVVERPFLAESSPSPFPLSRRLSGRYWGKRTFHPDIRLAYPGHSRHPFGMEDLLIAAAPPDEELVELIEQAFLEG